MMKDDIFYLTKLCGLTGEEDEVSRGLSILLEPLVDEMKIDEMGNLIGIRRCADPYAERLLLTAHMDQVGMVITDIVDEGFACVAGLGVDSRVMLGTKLQVLTEYGKLYCCSAALPPHLQKEGDDSAPVCMDQIWIDLGMNGEEARKLINPGDAVVFDVQPTMLLHDRATAAALDDRVGVACILAALRALVGKELHCELQVLFATMEESNHEGCAAAMHSLCPDSVIAVDVCHAKTIGCKEYDRVHEFGCGAVIAYGMNSMPRFAGTLERIALKNGIPYEREALPRKSFTDAWVAQTANKGARTAVVSIPLRHMHTPVEIIDLRDAAAVTELLKETCLVWEGLNDE